MRPFWPLSDTVALASYPRSGNTLLRRQLERATLTTTGSDARRDRALVQQLVALGMAGEGESSPARVWVVKTHFPERVGHVRVPASRAVLLVRNPVDAIASSFHMLLTGTHDRSVVDEDVSGAFAGVWRAFVEEEAAVWRAFHEHWRSASEDADVLVVRYEDLVANTHVELPRVVAFLYHDVVWGSTRSEVPPEQTKDAVLARVREVVGMDTKDVGVYAPRGVVDDEAAAAAAAVREKASHVEFPTGTPPLVRETHLPIPPSTVFRSLRLFSDEQVRLIAAMLRSELTQFGYWDALMQARPGVVSSFAVPFVSHPLSACILRVDADASGDLAAATTPVSAKAKQKQKPKQTLLLNKFWSVRPRTPDDPYGRGLDVRWGKVLEGLPQPNLKPIR